MCACARPIRHREDKTLIKKRKFVKFFDHALGNVDFRSFSLFRHRTHGQSTRYGECYWYKCTKNVLNGESGAQLANNKARRGS